MIGAVLERRRSDTPKETDPLKEGIGRGCRLGRFRGEVSARLGRESFALK
jgi:hypothetical protein